jgi:DNA-binding SARP family transcriptional activator/pimeloyl-ACP methyl ester carboxylesterase
MGELKIYLFGSPHIEVQGRIIDVSLRKALAILAYLGVTRRKVTRDALATLFWPEADQKTGRADLRRTIYNLKKIVGDALLAVSTDFIGIRSEAEPWIDVTVFEALTASLTAAHLPPAKLAQEGLDDLSEAMRLYCGDFMAGFNLADCLEFDEWQFFQREHWQGVALRAMDRLSKAYEANGEHQEAISCARRRLSFDRLHEPTHFRLMQLYRQRGEKAAAVRQYGLLKRLLKVELNTVPQDETIKLFQTIRSERIVAPLVEKTTSPKTRYAKSDKTYIAYQHLGKGPVDILFVTGFVSHIEYLWKEPELAAFYHRMAKSARLILFDKRGVGLSDRNGDPPNLDNTLEDIQAVLKASGSKGAVLIGASEGGPAIIKYAEAFPQHCKGLVLYGTMAKGTRSEDYPFALSREQYDKWLARLIGSWGGPVGIDSFAPSRKNDEPFRQWWATLLRLSSSPGNVRLVLEALRDIDVRQLLPRIKVPTLILHRKNDRAIPVAAGRYLAKHIPRSDFIELDGEDHWWWVGDTEPIVRNVESFLRSIQN